MNLIEHIEIYKGVVPTWFSSDALGGAVNIVINRYRTNYLDVSYGFGSYHTQKKATSTDNTYCAMASPSAPQSESTPRRKARRSTLINPPEKVSTVMETWDVASAPPTNWRMGASSMCRMRNERL